MRVGQMRSGCSGFNALDGCAAGDPEHLPRDGGPGGRWRPHREAAAEGRQRLPQIPREAQQLAEGEHVARLRACVAGMPVLRTVHDMQQVSCCVHCDVAHGHECRSEM